MRKILALIVGCLIAGSVTAEEMCKVCETLRLGLENTYTMQYLRCAGGGTVNGALTLGGGVKYAVPSSATAATNGASITLVPGTVNRIKAGGGAADAVAVVTLKAVLPEDVGKVTYVLNDSTATNSLSIAKSSVNYGGPTITNPPGGILMLMATATNVIYCR